ncbi:hypothetical protein BHM03_00056786, partial [Ensete ventricosum]
HDQPPCRGDRPPARGQPAAARPPARGGYPQWQQHRRHEQVRLGRKGLLPTARPQVATARCKAARGSPVARVAACKGGRWQERPPASKVPPEGSSAYRRGGCPRRWRTTPPPTKGNDGSGDVDGGKERARASF